ncbi:uncharacterized protein LOC142485236 [Ascaphus truei]|uniref:uncharacterized protein LOC142485236 n=1 Tax=Ascaphus truei TaxID=8439 RepID=UPI003F5A2A7C
MGQTPINVYKTLLSRKGSEGNHDRMAVDHPRNAKQVKNTIYTKRRNEKISRDEIFSLHELALQLDAFIWNITTYPDIMVFVGLPDIIRLSCSLLETSLKQKHPQLLSYDTTFQLGDFYLSVLVQRNTILENDPIYPVGFMLHERKCTIYHERFLQEVLGRLGMNSNKYKNIPIIVDREKAIVKALKKNFSHLSIAFCQVHMLRDVEFWIRKQKGGNDDVKVLKDHVEQLIDSPSPAEFNNRHENFSKALSESFKHYFEIHLKHDIQCHLVSYITQKFPAFEGKSATNNISESMNKMIRNQTEWKELPLDAMVLSLYYMQTYFINEFERAKCGLGNYNPKTSYYVPQKGCKIPVAPFYPLEDIIKRVKSNMDVTPCTVEKRTSLQMSQKSLAHCVVEMDFVSFHPHLKVFLVKSPRNDNVYTVKFTSKGPVCVFPSTGKCYHILAVEMTTNIFLPTKTTYSLSQMRKNARGREKKSGRKQPRAKDYNYSLDAAPDSLLSLMEEPSNLQDTMTAHHSSSYITEDEELSQKNTAELTHHVTSTPTSKTANHSLWLTIDMCIPDWSTVSDQYKSLSPTMWLEDVVIDQALLAFINISKRAHSVAAFPTYIFQFATNNVFAPVLRFSAANKVLNCDVFLIPFNTDVVGS